MKEVTDLNIINIKQNTTNIDMTPIVFKIINQAKGDNTIINFEKGHYHFWADKAYEKFYYISNNDSGQKRIAFPLINYNNITIDGNGAEFIMHGRIVPFVIDNSRNIVIKNITIDYNRAFFTQGRVVASGENFVDLVIEKKEFPYRIEYGKLIFIGDGWESDQIIHLLQIEPDTYFPSYGMSDDYCKGKIFKAKEVGENVVRLESSDFRYIYDVGKYVTISHEIRECPGIVISCSKNILIDKVNIYQAGAMGVIAQVSKDITLNNVNIKVRDGSDRVVSLNADATHFVNCYGKITMSNCCFESQLDDAVNVHGVYTIISDILSVNEIMVEFMHYQQYGIPLYSVGDTIAFIDRSTLLTIAQGRIADVKIINCKYVRLTFENSLPKEVNMNTAIENIDRMPDLEITGCLTGKNRARSFLISTRGKVLIENNELHSAGCAIKISGDANYWYESGAVTDVTIRKNKIVDCNFGIGWGIASIDIDPEVENSDKINGLYHHNISIIENEFDTFENCIVYARSVDGLRITDNKIIRTFKHKPTSPLKCFFKTTDCDHISITRNELVNIPHQEYCEDCR